jgi:hypothetical protein
MRGEEKTITVFDVDLYEQGIPIIGIILKIVTIFGVHSGERGM